MLSKSIEEALNRQIKVEGDSSQVYLAMASWNIDFHVCTVRRGKNAHAEIGKIYQPKRWTG